MEANPQRDLRILLDDPLDFPAHLQLAIRELAPAAKLVRLPRRSPAYMRSLQESEIVVGSLRPSDLPDAPNLRWLQMTSAGVHGWSEVPPHLTITTAAGIYAIPIAEHVMAMMLGLTRRLPETVRRSDRAEWHRPSFRELHGATCLIVGLGGIGEEVARRAKAFSMRVIGIRRNAANRPACVDEMHDMTQLDVLLPEADHVVLALPGTPHTRHLIGARRLALMKPEAMLYNVGRGSVVEEAALVEALKNGRLAGAGLDVFETEPLPSDSPLWGLPNVLLTSHCSAHTDRWVERVGELFVRNLGAYLAGRGLRNRYDPVWGY